MILRPGRRHTMTVSFEVHRDVDLSDVKDFIVEWLEGGGGCRHPDDPLFNSLDGVRVSLRRERKRNEY